MNDKKFERYYFDRSDYRKYYAPLTEEEIIQREKERKYYERRLKIDRIIDNIKYYGCICLVAICLGVIIFCSSISRQNTGSSTLTYMPLIYAMYFWAIMRR